MDLIPNPEWPECFEDLSKIDLMNEAEACAMGSMAWGMRYAGCPPSTKFGEAIIQLARKAKCQNGLPESFSKRADEIIAQLETKRKP